MFGSPDMPVFPAILLSDGDSVYSRETFQIVVQGQLVSFVAFPMLLSGLRNNLNPSHKTL